MPNGVGAPYEHTSTFPCVTPEHAQPRGHSSVFAQLRVQTGSSPRTPPTQTPSLHSAFEAQASPIRFSPRASPHPQASDRPARASHPRSDRMRCRVPPCRAFRNRARERVRACPSVSELQAAGARCERPGPAAGRAPCPGRSFVVAPRASAVARPVREPPRIEGISWECATPTAVRSSTRRQSKAIGFVRRRSHLGRGRWLEGRILRHKSLKLPS